MNRIALAALIGGAVVFVWGVMSHMVLPIGEMGLDSLPDEGPVLAALRSSVPEPGLYFFPGMAHGEMSKEEESAWTEKYKTGPAGLLVYKPVGGEPLSPRHLVAEFVTNVLGALVAAMFIVRIEGSLLRRALAVAGLGLFAWISISLSYWNWYAFPADFIVAEGIDQVAGWFLAGLAIAKTVTAPSR